MEARQAIVDSLVAAVRDRDALLSCYWLELLRPSGQRALSLPGPHLYLNSPRHTR